MPTASSVRRVQASMDPLWQTIRTEVADEAAHEPLLASFLYATVLNHKSLEDALGFLLAGKLESPVLPSMLLRELFTDAMEADPSIGQAMRSDLQAVRDRDPAAHHYSRPFLFFKGFQAIQSYRFAHWLWKQDREALALFLQSRVSEVFAVDIHPAARIGNGIMVDHATGLVVGETAVVEDNVSMLHGVTLGGTGKDEGDRHPKIRAGVLIGAGAAILGNVEVGAGAKVAAGSVVLDDVVPGVTVAGVPAVVVGAADSAMPAMSMNHSLDCPDGDCDE